MERVPPKQALEPEEVEPGVNRIKDMVEKPKVTEAPSNLAIDVT
jgi:UTP-glucose-1-phosphate uridylyltransferase